MAYQFLSSRTTKVLAKAFGDDFDLFTLASRPRKFCTNCYGEKYLASHLDLWLGPGIGAQGRVEIAAELAAEGFVFTDEFRRGKWKGFLNEKELCRVQELLAANGYRSEDVEHAIATFQAKRTGKCKKARRIAALERSLRHFESEVERVRVELATLQAAGD